MRYLFCTAMHWLGLYCGRAIRSTRHLPRLPDAVPTASLTLAYYPLGPSYVMGLQEYIVEADLMGRTLAFKNKRDETIAFAAKSTKALIQAQVRCSPAHITSCSARHKVELKESCCSSRHVRAVCKPRLLLSASPTIPRERSKALASGPWGTPRTMAVPHGHLCDTSVHCS
jgi:hypothetical protein